MQKSLDMCHRARELAPILQEAWPLIFCRDAVSTSHRQEDWGRHEYKRYQPAILMKNCHFLRSHHPQRVNGLNHSPQIGEASR